MAGRLASTKSASLGQVMKALCGDVKMTISPATLTPAPTAAIWSRTVTITITDSADNVHEWLTADYATTASIADTSSAGTAAIASTTLSIINGIGSVTVTGDAAAWLNTEADTLTIGNIDVVGKTVTGGTSVETFTTP